MRSCFGQREWGLEMTMPTKWWLVNGAIKVKSIMETKLITNIYGTFPLQLPQQPTLRILIYYSSIVDQVCLFRNYPTKTRVPAHLQHSTSIRHDIVGGGGLLCKVRQSNEKRSEKILHNTQCEIISLDMAYNNRVQLWLSAGTFTVNNSLSNNDIKNNNCLQWSLTPAPLIDNQKQQSSKAAKATRGRETLEWHIKVTSTTSID